MASLKYGIFGGTFNPIHYAHLFVANEVMNSFKLDRIIFMPTGTPPHKNNLNIDAFHRYSMTKLATASNDRFSVTDIEVLNQDISYTVDTMKKIKSNHPDIDFYFIAGTDAILEIPTWKDPKTLLALCKFIAVNRPSYVDETLLDKIKSITCEFGGEIFTVVGPELSISSTEIRQRVKEGKTIRYLVPNEVNDYIIKNKLYMN